MKKILIVDDSTFMRNVIKDTLVTNNDNVSLIDNLEFYEADGKINALTQVKKIKPDIILLDIVMRESETEGIEFLNEVKPYFDLSKVIMISAVGQIEIIEKCKNLGVTFYIQKPIENEQMLTTVNQVIRRAST